MDTLQIGGSCALFYILDDDRIFPKHFWGSTEPVPLLVSYFPPTMYFHELTYRPTVIVQGYYTPLI